MKSCVLAEGHSPQASHPPRAPEALGEDPHQTGTEMPLLGVLIKTDAGVHFQHMQGLLGGVWILCSVEQVSQDPLAQMGPNDYKHSNTVRYTLSSAQLE